MKLLILTQKVDRDDSVLGFMHRWIIEFAKKYDRVVVICLSEGTHDLPRNVEVLSLGKEKGVSKLLYILNFYRYIWQERRNYDTVFVHMNQEYVLLGWKVWKLLGKKILLWRNHPAGSLATRLAVAFSDRVFCTSPQAYTAKFKKTEVMPVGIDTEVFAFKPDMARRPRSVLFLGRMSPIKRVDVFVEALRILVSEGVELTATLIGDPTSKDVAYYENIKRLVAEGGLSERVRMLPAVPNFSTPDIYNQYEVYVNLTPPGSMDKTIFEAMACGCVPVVVQEGGADLIARKLCEALMKSGFELETTRLEARREVIEKHSLPLLVEKVYSDSYGY